MEHQDWKNGGGVRVVREVLLHLTFGWKTLPNLTAHPVPLLQENQKVKKDLLEAQTNIAFLQSELDALKSDYADQSLNSERYETVFFSLV